ncbi:MAG: DUF1329 domain-containing protein [Rhodocyclaceae bacterium]|nr:DUF1329 domain-containing protein [Rhodocyclaceae bacterium]
MAAMVAPATAQELTYFGAEVAGNKEGTIPPYTGGLPKDLNPPGFKPNSGRWVDPFADEKPLYSITAQNVAQYADKLSELQKELLKRYPTYRLDIYPTHRTANFSKFQREAMARNATASRLAKDGNAVEGATGCIPFPIPKNGKEVAWNHQLRNQGSYGQDYQFTNWYVDANGKKINGVVSNQLSRIACMNEKGGPDFLKEDGHVVQSVINNIFPPRVAGDGTLFVDFIDMEANPRRAWSYSASTRRIRLAPDLAYDTPVASVGGVYTYDDAQIIFGKLDRFDYKLIGKKEMFIPYSNYKALFSPAEPILGAKHANPDFLRWELHRVYVVEATLKPGFRHVYSKRIFYFDEDKTGAAMSDAFDSAGKLFRGTTLLTAQLWDLEAQHSFDWISYDLSTGLYCLSGHQGDGKGFFAKPEGFPNSQFTPDALVARSGR